MMEQFIAKYHEIGNLIKEFHCGFFILILINIVILLAIIKVLKILCKKLYYNIQKNDPSSPLLGFIPLLNKCLDVLAIFFIVASFLQSYGYSMSSIIAGFGITGLAVGFAAQETIADVFGSISILVDRVYKLGDYIKVNNIDGTVEDINLRSTKIRCLNNYLVVIPNHVMANAVIENISKAKNRLVDVTFGVVYGTTPDQITRAKQIISEIADTSKFKKGYKIFVNELASYSVNIRFFGYATTHAFFEMQEIKGKFLEDVYRRFGEENISFAYPSQSLYIEKTIDSVSRKEINGQKIYK